MREAVYRINQEDFNKRNIKGVGRRCYGTTVSGKYDLLWERKKLGEY
jgi:hypothetical protein